MGSLLFDELFHYIREIGAWPLLEGLDPNHREGALYPFLTFVLFTIMRCVGGRAEHAGHVRGSSDGRIADGASGVQRRADSGREHQERVEPTDQTG